MEDRKGGTDGSSDRCYGKVCLSGPCLFSWDVCRCRFKKQIDLADMRELNGYVLILCVSVDNNQRCVFTEVVGLAKCDWNFFNKAHRHGDRVPFRVKIGDDAKPCSAMQHHAE